MPQDCLSKQTLLFPMTRFTTRPSVVKNLETLTQVLLSKSLNTYVPVLLIQTKCTSTHTRYSLHAYTYITTSLIHIQKCHVFKSLDTRTHTYEHAHAYSQSRMTVPLGLCQSTSGLSKFRASHPSLRNTPYNKFETANYWALYGYRA